MWIMTWIWLKLGSICVNHTLSLTLKLLPIIQRVRQRIVYIFLAMMNATIENEFLVNVNTNPNIYVSLCVSVGFVTLANHVPAHLRSKKMSKVDTLRAAILYIQDLQDALKNDTMLPLDPCSDDIAASPTSITSSDSLPSSPNSTYQLPDLTCSQMSSQQYYHQNDSHFNTYQPNHPHMNYTRIHSNDINTYQTAPTTYYSNYNTTHSIHSNNKFSYDFSRSRSSSDICPSPSSSCYSSDHEPITPEVEAEILEFASWF